MAPQLFADKYLRAVGQAKPERAVPGKPPAQCVEALRDYERVGFNRLS